MPNISLPTPSPTSPSALPLSIAASFSPASSLGLQTAASRLGAPPFSLTSPINSSTLAPAVIPEDSPPPGMRLRVATRIAPIRRPEYPLFSRGGLGCEWVRQGSGSPLQSLAQQFLALLFVLHFAVRGKRSSSTRKATSNSPRSTIPQRACR